MAQNIILKRSSLSGKVPTTSSLNLGEIAINTYDGRAFIHKSGSTESVEHIVVTNSITTGSINITQTGSFGELVVTNDLNVGDSIYVTNDIVVGGDVDAVGAVTASFFVGDGSLLTGISAGATDNEIPSNDWDYNLPDSGTLSDGNNQSTKYTVDFQAEALMGRPVGYQTFITNDAGTTEIIPGRDEIKFIVNNIEVGKVDAGGIVGTTPMGTISSSAQITALGFVSSSISNIDTASLATTGSNIFIGNQTITGSAYISGSLYAANLIAGNSSSNFNSITVVTSDINFTSSLYSTIGIDVDTGGEHSAGISVSTYTQFGQTPATILYGGGSGSNATGANDSIYFQNGKIDIVKNTTISGSLNVTGSITGSTNFNTIVNKPTLISGSSQLTSSFETVGRGIISSSAQLPSGLISGSSQLPTGLVSGSSQLTSSYDTRYTLSGSVQPLPSGVISGSSQLTSSYDTRYLVTGSVTSSILQLNTFTASNANTSLNLFTSSLNTWSSSVATTGSNSFNGNQTITGSLTVTSTTIVAGAMTIPTGSTLSLTTGSSIFVDSSGAITGSLTGSVFGIGDVVAFSSSVNSRINSVIPAGTISGSSQLTSSYDLRYEGVGRGIVSGSTQLTSSFDGRYLQTGSFNIYTASINSYTSSNDTTNTAQNNRLTSLENKTGSLATTGSNSFNGSQTITGSVIQSGSLTTYGPNLLVGNTTITGSLLVSGSTTLTGSVNISSGSITMPNRPAIRITGAGGAKVATTPLTGSYLNVDYQQGNVWDSATGTFTAPIAGLYMVTLVVRTNSNSLGSISQLIVFKNNTTGTTGTPQIMVEFGTNTTMNHAGGSTISKLAVGDTLKMVVASGEISFDQNDNFSVAYIG